MAGLDLFLSGRDEKKNGDIVVTTPIAYPTGYPFIDYANGQTVQVLGKNDEIIEEYDSVGMVGGTMVTVLADSGLGKSTFVQQAAIEIIRPFENSFVIHEDIEQAAHINRIYNVSRMKSSWIKSHYRIYQDAHAETVVTRCIEHAKTKLNNRKEFTYKTGLKDMFGDEIISLVPSVVIIDSLAVMRSADSSLIDETSLGKKAPASKESDLDGSLKNNMSGARNAKFNSEAFKQLLPWCKKANIILFVINHINKKISTGFVKSARDLIGLGEDEAVSGGRAAVYLANNVLRFKNKGTLKIDKDYGLNGHIISAEFYKSRTNASQQPVELIFDKAKGFSKTLSLLHYLFEKDKIVKIKSGLYAIKGFEDIPFSKKNFREVAAQNPQLIVGLYDQTIALARDFISSTASPFGDDDDDTDKGLSFNDIFEAILED